MHFAAAGKSESDNIRIIRVRAKRATTTSMTIRMTTPIARTTPVLLVNKQQQPKDTCNDNNNCYYLRRRLPAHYHRDTAKVRAMVLVRLAPTLSSAAPLLVVGRATERSDVQVA